MATSVLSRKAGVIVGDDVIKLFKYAQEKKFAIPAIVRCCDSKTNGWTVDKIPECNVLVHRGRISRGCER